MVLHSFVHWNIVKVDMIIFYYTSQCITPRYEQTCWYIYKYIQWQQPDDTLPVLIVMHH